MSYSDLSIGIDIDGCIDDFLLFFKVLSSSWPGKVYIITCRSKEYKIETEEMLKDCEIKYDELIFATSYKEKSNIIKEKNIIVFFDDQPEVLNHILEDVCVMLVRNGGNFSFEDKKWIFSKSTANLI